MLAETISVDDGRDPRGVHLDRPFDWTGTLVRGLARRDAFPHEVREFRIVETHISIVVLTGSYAYKLKKPVNLGFLDFTTLDARLRSCREEIRLNRRTAPDIYLGVVPITGTLGFPRVGGGGEVLDVAVKMRQFAPRSLMTEMLEDAPREVEAALVPFARRVADFHESAPRCTLARERYLERAFNAAQANFFALEGRLHPPERYPLAGLWRWVDAEWPRVKGALAERLDEGRVRECHGDLHCANVVRSGGRLVPFDCIEFSETLRVADVMSDAAFLEMDLRARGFPGYANAFLNGYLQRGGDYGALAVRPFFLVYRALVRAKVAAIAEEAMAISRYLVVAAELGRTERKPAIILMHGLSGSGKTHLARAMAARIDAVHLRSDVERKRLAGVPALEHSSRPELYDVRTSEATYRRLARLSGLVLANGQHAVVDAAFLAAEQRAGFERLASTFGWPLGIVHAQAPENVLRSRIDRRLAGADDESDANQGVLTAQIERQESLTAAEAVRAIEVDTTRPDPLERCLGALRAKGLVR